MIGESSSELTFTQQQFVKESDSRNKVAKELLENALTFKEKVQLFWNDTKEKLSIGKYVNRVDIEGNVGDELKVNIGGINLNEFLPEGVIFRGVKVGSDFEGDHVVPISGPFYDPYSNEICIPVSKEKGVETRTMDELKNSGLVTVHEMGHAIDDKDRVNRLDSIELARTEERLYRNCASEGSWFSEQHFRVLKEGKTFDNNLIQTEITEIVQKRLDNMLSKGERYDLKARLRIRLTDETEFVNKAVSEVSTSIYRIYELARTKAIEENPESAIIFVKKSFEAHIKSTSDRYDEEWARESAKSERQAWARGLEIARKLTNKHGIRFWDKSFNELNFFIDSLINAHGVNAGRKGVRNPANREALHIPN